MRLKARVKHLHLLLLGVLMAAMLAACSSTATNTAGTAATTAPANATTAPAVATTASTSNTTAATASSPTSAPVSASTSSPTAAPAAQGGTFRYRNASEAKTLDPGFITDSVSNRIGQNIYEGVYEFDPKLQVIPAAAEAMPTISADGKVYTIKLRKDMKWSNGDPLTAKDFLYSWNRVLQAGALAQYASLLYDIEGAEAISLEKDQAKREAATASGLKALDDYTLEITLRQPTSYFVSELALWTFWPVNQKVVESKGKKFDDKSVWWTDAANIVTNGPFVLKEWKHDVSMRFEPNPYYNGKIKPSISAVTVDIIKEDATAKLKFDNNELDDTIVPISDVNTVRKDAKYKESYVEVPAANTSWLAFNFGKENIFSKNVKLRQAFAHAMDREFIVEGALQGAAVPTTTLIPPGFLSYKKSEQYPLDPAKAKALLKEAGYDDPKKLEDEINNWGGGKSGGIAFNADSSANKAFAEAVQQSIKQNLGLNIKLNPVATFKEFLQRRDVDKEFILYRGSWGADFPDPQNFYDQLFTSTAGNNTSGYNNPKFDALVKQGNSASTPQQRVEFYQQAEKILQDDVALIPLFNGIQTYLVRPTIQNYSYTSQRPTLWKYMTIKQK